jgi:hypothetical protein
MHRTVALSAVEASRKLFPVVLLLCLATSGCGYGCYSGFWNGNASGVAFSNSSCPLIKATGAVIVQVGTASAPTAASAVFLSPLASPRDVQHIFVTLRGIQARPSMTGGEDSYSWQEFAPGLAAHPLQLDLLAPSSQLALSGNSPSLEVPVSAKAPATVPADEYRQLRLRLLPQDPGPDDVIPERNACGNVGWNCIVFGDRSVRPLEFAPSRFAAAAEFHIPPELAIDSVFRILPGEVICLSIAFDPGSSIFFASNEAVHVGPVFRVVSRSSSPAASAE